MQGLVGKHVGKRQLVVRMGDTGSACRFWWGNVRERDSLWHVLETLDVHGGFGGET